MMAGNNDKMTYWLFDRDEEGMDKEWKGGKEECTLVFFVFFLISVLSSRMWTHLFILPSQTSPIQSFC